MTAVLRERDVGLVPGAGATSNPPGARGVAERGLPRAAAVAATALDPAEGAECAHADPAGAVDRRADTDRAMPAGALPSRAGEGST